MICHRGPQEPSGDDRCGRLLLIGNPNVGKSALFSRLTGLDAVSSNYPGTTIGFLEGTLEHRGKSYRVIDVPGAYTLSATNEAEEIARRIVDEGAQRAIIVLDATALERNLVLAMEVLERKIPSVVALNMVDEARHKGIIIDIQALERELGVPVVPTVAVTGQGIRELLDKLDQARESHLPQCSKEERWNRIGNVVDRVQRVEHRHHTLVDKLEDASVNPIWGSLLGILILGASLYLVRGIGEGLISHVFDPLFEGLLRPILEDLARNLGDGMLRKVLIGTLFQGKIDFELSFGLLTTGLYVEFAMVLPYIIAFYGVLSLLEDVGYLPRLAILFDALLHRMGIHGYAVIPTLLGLGCNVPGILATRVLESKRERFIASTLISVAVPCTSLQAMVVGALGDSPMHMGAVYLTLLSSWVIIGRILHRLLPGFSPELIVEIPPYRRPSPSALWLKLRLRVKDFLLEATPLVLGGILLVNGLEALGVMDLISAVFGPPIRFLTGLPPSAAGPIVMGLFRKDVAVGLLLPLGLTVNQMTVAVTLLAMTFPCIATFVVLLKELGSKDTMKSLLIMVIAALSAGSILNGILKLTTH
ncbi:small GTP-binding protein domain protein [Thermanaerovibrio velox DSM 12556]|uniref:Small GTP-binding protein domain protein n=1 Tax=Thermanaerovibrio velox DSM 12556 TaxID=926567 RepID=H0UNB6_9BACT|nr:small GTP-binding protein domain protein [Thermanaerovibrio velox DSM 12556]